MPANPIRLIVGLGNPGNEYANTRHNAGAWFAGRLAQQLGGNVQAESKFFGKVGRVIIQAQPVHIIIPGTYMNESGKSVLAIAQFFKLSPADMLVAHDELDHDIGCAKLKFAGGHGGHNGLRDITKVLGSNDFARLRLGIGHPGDRSRVTSYVLGEPSSIERMAIDRSIDWACDSVPDLVAGEWNRSVRDLHNHSTN